MALPILLLVDDEYINLEIMSAMLEKDFDVRVAFDGATALEILETVVVDIVLLDVQMPGMNGYEVAQAIQAADTFDSADKPKPKVYFISASAKSSLEQACVQYGADGYFLKPIHRSELLSAILMNR